MVPTGILNWIAVMWEGSVESGNPLGLFLAILLAMPRGFGHTRAAEEGNYRGTMKYHNFFLIFDDAKIIVCVEQCLHRLIFLSFVDSIHGSVIIWSIVLER